MSGEGLSERFFSVVMAPFQGLSFLFAYLPRAVPWAVVEPPLQGVNPEGAGLRRKTAFDPINYFFR